MPFDGDQQKYVIENPYSSATDRRRREQKNKTLDIIKLARTLIADPENWIQGRYYCYDPKLGRRRYCAIGAVRMAARDSLDESRLSIRAIRALETDLHPKAVHIFNDTHSHRKVIALFDRTIQRLETQK